MTFEEKSVQSNNHSTGFDYLRIGLSLSVLAVHCFEIADYAEFKIMWASSAGPLFSIILPSFFALSGYLVAGSLLRNSIPAFIVLRVIRIFPALAVEILLTAFIVGTVFTTVPLGDYFGDPMFWRYFQNAIGIIHYPLPGLFHGAPANMQLWTVPFEFECYFLLVLIGLLRIHLRPYLFLAVTVLLYIIFSAYFVVRSNPMSGQNVPGKVLVLCFLFGCSSFLLKRKIPFSAPLLIISLIIAYCTLLNPKFSPLCAPAVTYATIYIGLLKLPRLKFGDLSYGVFLFHSPVARSIYEIGRHQIGTGLLIVLTVPLTSAFALMSWHIVEEPILRSKKWVIFIVGIAVKYATNPFNRGANREDDTAPAMSGLTVEEGAAASEATIPHPHRSDHLHSAAP